jgi:DNA mismatch repair protein MutS2
MLSPGSLEAEALLDEIHQQYSEIEQSRASAAAAEAAAEHHEQELQGRLADIEDERREILEEARQRAADDLGDLRRQVKELRRELTAARQPLDALQAVDSMIEDLEREVETPVEPGPKSPEWTFRSGDFVRVRSLGQTGVISELGEQEAEIQVGKLRVRARLEELEPAPPAGDQGEEAGRRSAAGRAQGPAAKAPPLELDLRGTTVEAALQALEQRLDAALLAGSPQLRIIHGKGTGRLREAVRQALGESVYVSAFKPGDPRQGGDGVTIVELAG